MRQIETKDGSNFILSNAPLIAIEPNFVDETPAKVPPKEPNGVLTADTIYTSFFIIEIIICAKCNIKIAHWYPFI